MKLDVYNPNKKTKTFHSIMQSVATNAGQLFLVSGYGGTCKTFLWKTIISKLCLELLVVLPVAASGIADLLLLGR